MRLSAADEKMLHIVAANQRFRNRCTRALQCSFLFSFSLPFALCPLPFALALCSFYLKLVTHSQTKRPAGAYAAVNLFFGLVRLVITFGFGI